MRHSRADYRPGGGYQGEIYSIRKYFRLNDKLLRLRGDCGGMPVRDHLWRNRHFLHGGRRGGPVPIRAVYDPQRRQLCDDLSDRHRDRHLVRVYQRGTGKQAEGPYVDHYDRNDERDLWRDDEGDQRRPAAWLPGVVLQEGGILFIRGFRGNACGSHGNCLVYS